MSLEGTAKTEYASLSGKIHTIVIDKTLTVSGACADAKATGEAIMQNVAEAAQEALKDGVKSENPYSLLAGGKDRKLADVGVPAEDPSVLFGRKNALPEWKSLNELAAAIGAGKFETKSYPGVGKNDDIVLTFSFAPKFLVVTDGLYVGIFAIAAGKGLVLPEDRTAFKDITVTANGNSVTLPGSVYDGSMRHYPLNTNPRTYYSFAWG